jgi:hypothetical protein
MCREHARKLRDDKLRDALKSTGYLLNPAQPLRVCTIAARNRMAHVRVLADSLAEHHDPGSLTVFLIDDLDGAVAGSEPDLHILTPEDVFADIHEFHRMAGIYSVIELATAVKPTLLERLLKQSSEVLYLDPDVLILSSIADLQPRIREHSIVLTPHYTEPPTGEGAIDWEFQTMIRGVFNCGFIAVSHHAGDFLAWWKERVARHCFYAPDEGYFVDQVWVDMVPSYFEYEILRDPGWNVAPWNTSTRTVSFTDGRYLVNGTPLRFFHFSAFEPEQPYLLSRWLLPEPRTLLSENPALAQLCDDYARSLFAARYESIAPIPYAFDRLPNGVEMNTLMRQVYYRALTEAERRREVEPPNPVEAPDAFVHWLTEPPTQRHVAAGVTRYMEALWNGRTDLQLRFPDLIGADGPAFRAWLDEHGSSRVEPPIEVLRAPRSTAKTPHEQQEPTHPGVDLVFDPSRDNVYFVTAHRLADAIAQDGTSLSVHEIPFSAQSDAGTLPETSSFRFDNLILVLPPESISGFAYRFSVEFFASRRTIAAWADHVMHPDRITSVSHLLDEIWAASDYLVAAIEDSSDCHVELLPAGVPTPQASNASGVAVNGTGNLRFLWLEEDREVYDPLPVLEAIDAYAESVSSESGHSFLICISTFRQRWVEFERIRLAVHRPDIETVIKPLSSSELAGVLSSADCFVSLGPGVATNRFVIEAMAQGKPVIATAPPADARLVDRQTGHWLPSGSEKGTSPERAAVALAAKYLGNVIASPDGALRLGRAAAERTRALHGSGALQGFVRTRILAGRTTQIESTARPIQREATMPTGFERAVQYIQTGPQNAWSSPSRMGRLGSFLRRVSLRFMRPYILRHQELDSAVVEALGELHHRQLDVEHRLRALENDPDERGTEQR